MGAHMRAGEHFECMRMRCVGVGLFVAGGVWRLTVQVCLRRIRGGRVLSPGPVASHRAADCEARTVGLA